MGKPTGLIVAGPSGGAQPDIIFPIPVFGSGTAAWPNADRGLFIKFRLDKPTSITGVSIFVVSASGNFKAALYASDGTTLTQVAAKGATAASGTNAWQDLTFATPYAGQPFVDYHAFVVADNTSVQVARTTSPAAASTPKGRLALLLESAYTTPPVSQAISGLSGTSLFIPIFGILTSG